MRTSPPAHGRRCAHAQFSQEAAFSIIELLVVMVLAAIVLAIGVKAFSGTISGARESQQKFRADRSLQQVRMLLEQDLRSVRTVERTTDYIRDRDVFARAIRGGRGSIVEWVGGSRQSLDLADVKVATSTQLIFVSEVQLAPIDTRRQAGLAGGDLRECVEWRIVSDTSTWSITRQVGAYLPGSNSCSFGVQNAQNVIPPQRIIAGHAAPRDVFAYRLVCDPAACHAPTNCQGAQVVASPNAAQRLWIGTILVNLHSLVVDDATAKALSYQGEVAIRSHASDDYLYAVGCSDQIA